MADIFQRSEKAHENFAFVWKGPRDPRIVESVIFNFCFRNVRLIDRKCALQMYQEIAFLVRKRIANGISSAIYNSLRVQRISVGRLCLALVLQVRRRALCNRLQSSFCD